MEMKVFVDCLEVVSQPRIIGSGRGSIATLSRKNAFTFTHDQHTVPNRTCFR